MGDSSKMVICLGMNGLAGRLNETPRDLFSLFMHGKEYCEYLVQPVKMSAAQLAKQICCGLLTPATSIEGGKTVRTIPFFSMASW